ncbi:MAG: DUF2269 domain-containing protein [Alphaproteobacteria bacterium]|nr:DUF2269 domain-containing protein [Alphaproteobacteria bacterium]
MSVLWFVKWLHVIGACVLFGTGVGIAFFLWTAHLSRQVAVIAHVATWVVRADWLFTLTSGVLQPITGAALIVLGGHDPGSAWLLAAYGLYGLALVCWLPVVWIQLRVRDLAVAAAATGAPLPPRYAVLMRWWFALGWPAFGALLAVFALMIVRPL